jgi:uncharacterized protein YegP (UPF0339 family)
MTPNAYFEVFSKGDGGYSWRLIATNGASANETIIAKYGGSWPTRDSANRSAANVANLAASAERRQVEGDSP